jgi:two-component system chemotaxis response regulator CheY
MRMNRAQGKALTDLDVVVVDDSKPIQAIVRTILIASRVARVRTFDSAMAAFDAMTVEPPHILLTDWMMPGLDGLALVRRMRGPRAGALATVPTILLTAHAKRALIEQAIDCGVHYVLVKPLSPANVMKRIEAVIADQRQFVWDEGAGIFALEDRTQRLGETRARRAWTDYRLAEVEQRYKRSQAPKIAPPPIVEPSPEEPMVRAVKGRSLSPGLGVPLRRTPAETATGQARSRMA